LEGPRVVGSWTLTTNGETTDVILTANYDLPGGLVGRLVGAFVRANAQNDLDASLRELKRLVESGL
jgi:hypothetical protein